MKPSIFLEQLQAGAFDAILKKLYGTPRLTAQKRRYANAVAAFQKLYPNRNNIAIFSAPGRTEVGGNHTDHQHGCVLAAAVNLDVIAVAAFHRDGVIRIKSAGYPADLVELDDLSVHPSENGTSAALIRGIAAKFVQMGVRIGGFDAYTTSDVLSGSGLSSSAAFEVLIGTMLDLHDNQGKAGAVEIAKIGQFAENEYFGKKSGLMDQMVSSVGGFVFIDFENTQQPHIKQLSCRFSDANLQLCITDTKGSHADLTDDYVSVPAEMHQVAAQFGQPYLRTVSEEAFYQRLPKLRDACSDRALLRAAHFFRENRRAQKEAQALSENRINDFLQLIQESGDSSAKWLQNLYSCSKPQEQAIPLGLMVSQKVLQGKGASRVHGGGFAGTIQAFVPHAQTKDYIQAMDQLFGSGSCRPLQIRPVGGTVIIMD